MNRELKLLTGLCAVSISSLAALDNAQIGREVSIAVHLKDGDELQMPIPELVAFGGQLFQARRHFDLQLNHLFRARSSTTLLEPQ